MMRSWLDRRRGVPTVIVILTLTGPGCSATGFAGNGRDPRPQKCEKFTIDEDPIEITRRGGRIKLGGGNFLVVPEDAVSQSRKYDVKALTDGTDKITGVRIVAQDGQPTVFELPAVLLLTYKGCDTLEAEPNSFVMIRITGGTPDQLPGKDYKNKKYVAGLIETLSDFAIAL